MGKYELTVAEAGRVRFHSEVQANTKSLRKLAQSTPPPKSNQEDK